VSQYDFTTPVGIFKLDCAKNRQTCNSLGIEKTNLADVRLYIDGKESIFSPKFKDTERILEYIDKLASPDIVNIQTSKELINFSKNHGDVSFLLIDKDITISTYYKCYERAARYYKPLFYFGYMSVSKYRNNFNVEVPALVVIYLPNIVTWIK
jgi:hypothetical protein